MSLSVFNTLDGHSSRIFDRACGCDAVRIDAPGEVMPALKAAIESGRPWLIDVISAADAHPPISLYDGTLDKLDVIEATI